MDFHAGSGGREARAAGAVMSECWCVQSETVAGLCRSNQVCFGALACSQCCSACPEVVRLVWLVQMEEARFDRWRVQRAERGSGLGGPRALDGRSCGAGPGCRGARGRWMRCDTCDVRCQRLLR